MMSVWYVGMVWCGIVWYGIRDQGSPSGGHTWRKTFPILHFVSPQIHFRLPKNSTPQAKTKCHAIILSTPPRWNTQRDGRGGWKWQMSQIGWKVKTAIFGFPPPILISPHPTPCQSSSWGDTVMNVIVVMVEIMKSGLEGKTDYFGSLSVYHHLKLKHLWTKLWENATNKNQSDYSQE